MLLHDARRDARVDQAGDLVVLDDQNRRRWNQRRIAEALPLVEEAFSRQPWSVRGTGGDRGPALPGCAARTPTGLKSSSCTICWSGCNRLLLCH
jgi:hypothetical protein